MCIYYTIKLNSSQCRFADEANGPHEWDKYVFTLCRQGERLQKHCSDSRPDQAVAGAASAQMVICPICTSLKEAEEEYERAKAAALDYSTVEYVREAPQTSSGSSRADDRSKKHRRDDYRDNERRRRP